VERVPLIGGSSDPEELALAKAVLRWYIFLVFVLVFVLSSSLPPNLTERSKYPLPFTGCRQLAG